MMLRLAPCACLFLLLAAPLAGAAEPTGTAGANPLALDQSSGPLEVTAQQSLEWREQEQMYRALGQAKAKRGDITIGANELRAFQRTTADGKKQIYKFTAHTGVLIESKAQKIYGDEAVYDTDKQLATLTGKDLRFVSAEDTVTAQEALEYWPEKRQAIARGQAMAVRDDRRVTADRLIAQFAADKKGDLVLEQLVAEGHVVITTKTDVARGDRAVYDLVNNSATLTGAVQITRGASQLAGASAVVDFKTGISRLTGGGGAVQALFVPGENQGAGAIGLPQP